MRFRFPWTLIVSAGLLVIVGCSVSSETPEGEPASLESVSPVAAGARQTSGELGLGAARSRRLIRRGRLEIEVQSMDESVARSREAVTGVDGYLSDESSGKDASGARRVRLVVKVPVEGLDVLLVGLRALGEVLSLDLSSEDITEKYVDLEMNLVTLRTLEERLLSLLGRSTNELDHLLTIERELARVRGEIDQMEGRRRLWEQQVALATLEVELAEPGPAIAGESGGAWRTLTAACSSAVDNFVWVLAALISAIGGLAPLAVPIVLAGFLWLRRKRSGVEEVEVAEH